MEQLAAALNPLNIITAVLNLIYSLTSGLLNIPISVLNWAANNSISFTHQPVVTLGWQICRDLVNIGLVLALIVVAIEMILKMNEYGSWKSLFGLIIVAILVNFTPVICGLIIDIANITMNVFKQPAIDSLTEATKSFDLMKTIFNSSSSIGVLIAGIMFNVIIFFVFFIYALIFLIRIPVLWVLVIISPFALLGYFYPFARSIKNEWEKQFFQWTIIGIPLFFFLYLAGQIYKNPVCEVTSPTGTTMADWMNGPFLCGLLSIAFPIFFLIIGLGMAFTFRLPKEMADIARKGEARSKQWLSSAGRYTGTAIRDTATVTKAEGAIRRRMETIPVISNVFGGPGAYDKELNDRRKSASLGLSNINTENLRRRMNMPLTSPREKAEIINILAERKNLGKQDEKNIDRASLYGVNKKDIWKKNPHLAETPNDSKKIIANLKTKGFQEILENSSLFKAEAPPVTPGGPNTYTDQQREIFYRIVSERDGKKEGKFNTIVKEGEDTRRAFVQFVKDNRRQIGLRMNNLRTSGNPEDQKEYKKLFDAMRELYRNPNYKF